MKSKSGSLKGPRWEIMKRGNIQHYYISYITLVYMTFACNNIFPPGEVNHSKTLTKILSRKKNQEYLLLPPGKRLHDIFEMHACFCNYLAIYIL